jgi:putative transposase
MQRGGIIGLGLGRLGDLTRRIALKAHDIPISVDGNGAWRDNVFVGRLWCTIKFEQFYLRAYDSAQGARRLIACYLDLYNRRHPHWSLDGRTPDKAYFEYESMPPIRSAA